MTNLLRLLCKECGGGFETERTDKEFCRDACRRRFNNRRAKRGAAIYDLAMEWRDTRQSEPFSDLCALISRYLDEDRVAGRQTYFGKEHRKRYERDTVR